MKFRLRIKKMSPGTVTACVMGVALCLTGCGSSSVPTNQSNSAKTSSSSSSTSGDGTVTYALAPQSNLNWFIPIANSAGSTAANFEMIYELYKPILWINPNYTINWHKSIASKITYNKKGTVYHLYLNPKWHWSNGQPVSSKDVLFTWNVIKAASAANAPSPWPYIGVGAGDIPNGVKSVVENSEHEVTFTLDKPANQHWFIYNGIIQLILMPSAWDIHKNIDNEIKYLGTEASNPSFVKIVDGPFRLVKAVPYQSWTLVPNKNYDGHKSTLKKLVFDYESSNASEFAGLKTGAINVGYLDLSQYTARSELTSMGDTITPEYAFGYSDTQLNMFPGAKTAKIFDHLYVRQAMQMGIDEDAINKDIYHGYAPPTYGPIPTVPATQFLDPELSKPIYPYNPSKGLALMESHGWKMQNGILVKGSEKMKFVMLYVSGVQAGQDEAELMKQDWAAEGISVTLKPMPISTFITITSNPKQPNSWQMATGLGWDYNGPGYYPTGGELFGTGAPSGFGYSNSEEDKLIAATHQPYTSDTANLHAFWRYENFTAEHLPVLWNNNAATLIVNSANVHGVAKNYDGPDGNVDMQYWSLAK
ncbi:MAG: peptide ABC transporter substrate-binding protein [Alicyclobacillaceae bacterium]|nr:peptide ABC transporter substrate-binding protein [Alicyclobacillaceae bacterium]